MTPVRFGYTNNPSWTKGEKAVFLRLVTDLVLELQGFQLQGLLS